MKSKALMVTNYMELGYGEVTLNDELKPDEILVKTKACGVCAWDSSLYQGVNIPKEYPFPLGHEGVGVVEKVGSMVENIKPGDNVFTARRGTDQFSEYFINNIDGVVKLPEKIDKWESFIYEPTSCVVNLLNKVDIKMGDHVVLVGAGYMGLQALMGLSRSTQCGEITVFELREDRRKMAKKYVDSVYDPMSEEGKKIIENIINKGGADVVIEFGASTSAYELSDTMTKKAGKLVIASFHRDKLFFYGPKWHLGGLTVYNVAPDCNEHYEDMIPRAYEMIKKGIYSPDKLITHTAHFDNLEEVKYIFDRSVDKKDDYMKGAILFD